VGSVTTVTARTLHAINALARPGAVGFSTRNVLLSGVWKGRTERGRC